jgi:hypothetical protein
MRRHASFVISAFALAGALAFAACESSTSNSSCGSGTPPSLVGTYALVSYTIGLTTVTTADGASGELRFHASTYGASINVPGTGVLADSGSYTVTGAKCISQSSVMGQPQFTGTFTLSGTTSGSTFTVSGSAAGQVVASAWTKQ